KTTNGGVEMQYLVNFETMEIGTLPPQQVAQILENRFLPSVEIIKKQKAEGKILAGGIEAGGKGGVVIVEVDSNEELSQLLTELPNWGLLNITVTPLESFEFRASVLRKMVEKLKAMA
ncbi:MAG: muconolactone Delta-isomerase family protein, partial [Planctomycetota bacterium]